MGRGLLRIMFNNLMVISFVATVILSADRIVVKDYYTFYCYNGNTILKFTGIF
jgi:hypothetical protein